MSDASTDAPTSSADPQSDASPDPQSDASPDDEPGVRKWPILGVLLAFLWLFVRGVDLSATRIVGEFLIGLAVGLPIAFLLRRFYSDEWALAPYHQSIPKAIHYLVVFLWELLTANVDVARRVLLPSLPIEPDVIEVPLRVETDLAITTIANSITLTPGTLTMDYNPERNSLYVHAITATDPESLLEPIRSWEDLALEIFREPGDPSDPVPSFAPDAPDDATDSGGEGDRPGGRGDATEVSDDE